MKVDRSKLTKSTSDMTPECRALIDKIRSCETTESLYLALVKIKEWDIATCELQIWADVLDKLDEVLERCCHSDDRWSLACNQPENEKDRQLLLVVLQFSALLIEHSFAHHLYSSMEHLTTLLSSSDITVVLAVTEVLYVFSKRSNFITRLAADKKQALIRRLLYLAESWKGEKQVISLASCCQDLPRESYPSNATTLHFEYYETQEENSDQKAQQVLRQIHVPFLDQSELSPAELMHNFTSKASIPKDKEMQLFTHIRLAMSFSNYEKRLQFVQARLQALSILVYSNLEQKQLNSLLYNGFVEELVQVLKSLDPRLAVIKAAVVRTLTSLVHERNEKPWTRSVILATGSEIYQGLFPKMMRQCISQLIGLDLSPFDRDLTEALFSLCYHMAVSKTCRAALISCRMLEALLGLVNPFGNDGQNSMAFATKAVFIIDLLAKLDQHAFQSLGGMATLVNRLKHEVDICHKEQLYVIRVKQDDSSISESSHMSLDDRYQNEMDTSFSSTTDVLPSTSADLQVTGESIEDQPTSSNLQVTGESLDGGQPTSRDAAVTCLPQRSTLMKSILDLFKKAMADTSFVDNTWHLVDGSLPLSLIHVLSNAQYYGPSLFLLAMEITTNSILQKPMLLSSLQSNGLAHALLQATLIKEMPITKEVLSSLPNVFSALCLNNKGLEAFVKCHPFDRLFKMLLAPDHLPALRARQNLDTPGDVATRLGAILDNVMSLQTKVPPDMTKQLVQVVNDISWVVDSAPKKLTKKRLLSSASESPGKGVSREMGSVSQRKRKRAKHSSSKDKAEVELDVEDFKMPPESPDPDIAIMNASNNIIFVDGDNWKKDLTSLCEELPDAFLWIFHGGKNIWSEPLKDAHYRKARLAGRVFVTRCGDSKDAVDFAIVLRIGLFEDKVDKSIPITILSGDNGFKEVQNHYETEKRRLVVISPHHEFKESLSTFLSSVVDV